jgi:pyruvate kinase
MDTPSSQVPRMQLQAADASTHLDHMCALDIDSKASYVRLSGIICTIGGWRDYFVKLEMLY